MTLLINQVLFSFEMKKCASFAERNIIVMTIQALRTLFHIEGKKFFKKGQLQGRSKQLNLEQDPDHNTG